MSCSGALLTVPLLGDIPLATTKCALTRRSGDDVHTFILAFEAYRTMRAPGDPPGFGRVVDHPMARYEIRVAFDTDQMLAHVGACLKALALTEAQFVALLGEHIKPEVN